MANTHTTERSVPKHVPVMAVLRTGKPILLRVSVRDKIIFAKHLSVMLDAGIPLRESLVVLQEQLAQSSLRYILETAIASVDEGIPLSTSLGKFPQIFDVFFTNTISIGESSGTLPSSLRYLVTQLEKADELRGKIRSALFYPCIVLLGAFGIGAYLAFYLLPKLLPIFVSLRVTLPPTTRALLVSSQWLQRNWILFLFGIVLMGFAMFFLSRIARVASLTERLILAFPVFGSLVRNIQTAKCTRILGTLLQSGVKIVPALSLTANSLDHLVYRKAFLSIAAAVERGETIGSVLKTHERLFSRTTVSMVGVGERTGKLPESLLALAEFTEREVDNATRNLSTLIEPLTLLGVGLLVGFIAISIITPIYQLTQGIKYR